LTCISICSTGSGTWIDSSEAGASKEEGDSGIDGLATTGNLPLLGVRGEE
jgi:hypothetical protein